MNHTMDTEALLRETRWLERLARGLVGDPDRAADVVQETMVRALTRPPRIGPDGLRPWLAAVARNLARSRLRRDRLGREVERAHAALDETDATADVVARAEVHRAAVDAVLGLAEPYRSAVLLRFLHDMPPREVAARTGVGVETARTRIKRGLQQVRETLDGRPGGRRAWVGALGLTSLPVAAGPIGGVALMGVKAKLLVAAGVLVAAALAITLARPDAAPTDAGAPSGEPALARLSSGAVDEAPAGSPERVVVEPGAGPQPPTDLRRLRGVVVAEETGAPIRGAVVALRAAAGSLAGETTVVALAETREDGAFTLAFEPEAIEVGFDSLCMEVRVDGRAIVREDLRRNGEDPERASRREDVGSITVPPGTTVAGRVVDAGGVRPVEGATLVVAPDWVWQVDGTASVQLEAAFGAAVSDAAGRFALRHPVVSTGWKSPLLVAVHETGIGWLELGELRRSEHRIDDVEVALRPGFDLEVVVRDTALRPVASATVRVEPCFVPLGTPGRWSHALGPLRKRLVAETDSTGFARLSALPVARGGYRVFVEGFVRTEVEVAEPGTTHAVQVTLPPRALVVRGTVTNGSGTPIRGASVSSVGARAETDERGGYELTVERQCDPFGVQVRAEGYANARTVVDPNDDAEPRVDFSLVPGGTLSGVVIDEGGAPVVGARVHAQSASARTDEEGRFAIPSLPLEPHPLTVTSAGAYLDHDAAPPVPGAAPVTIRVTARPDVLVLMTARVVDVAGRPVEVVDASVIHLDEEGREGDREFVELRIGAVEAMLSRSGTWRLTVRARTGAESVVEFEVQPGQTEACPSLVVAAGTTVRCRVGVEGDETPERLRVACGPRGQQVRFAGEHHEVGEHSITLDLTRSDEFDLTGVDPDRPVELVVDERGWAGELLFVPRSVGGAVRLGVDVAGQLHLSSTRPWPEDELRFRLRRAGEVEWREAIQFAGLAARTELLRWPLPAGHWEWRIDAPAGVAPAEGTVEIEPGAAAPVRVSPR